MLPYQDRVIAEHAELTERVEKLSVFLTRQAEIATIEVVEHRLLSLQRLAMLIINSASESELQTIIQEEETNHAPIATIEVVEHRLLSLQRLAMLMYQAILAERIAMWPKS